MASRIGNAPLRTLSAKAAAAAVGRKKVPDALKVTKLPNGLAVASFEEEAAAASSSRLSSVSVMVKAGSRYETYDGLGLTHLLRASVGLSSGKYTGFGITRNIQQAGSFLTASGGRDVITYHTSFLGDTRYEVLEHAFDAVANPKFKRWELPEAKRWVDVQVAEVEPQARAVDLLHKAAYREGLGNSIFCPEHMLGKHRPRDLEAYHKKMFTSERTMVVGAGIDHGLLVQTTQEMLKLGEGSGQGATSPPPAKFFAGDERHHTTGPVTHVAVAADGGNISANPKEAMALYFLQMILGGGARVKRGVLSGKLAKALPAEGSYAISGLCLGYEGASLLGFLLSSEKATVGENLAKAVAAFRSLDVTEADMEAARNSIRVELGELLLTPSLKCELTGWQALVGANFGPASDALTEAIVDTVTIADVKAAVKKMSGARLSLGACGNLANVPYADTL